MNIVLGEFLLARLCKALGITGAVERIVIDVPADNVARVYVQRVMEEPTAAVEEAFSQLTEEEKPAIVQVEGIHVSEKGEIEYASRQRHDLV